MRILVSAFAYAPHRGSEPGVGWRWALELSKTHEVTVLTDESRRSAVEMETLPSNIAVAYYRPTYLRGVPLNSLTATVIYLAWQFGVLALARRLHARQPFDVAIHCTYGVFRHPSFLGLLGIPFVFGPLGGGEDAPRRLKVSIKGRERFKEMARFAANRLALVDPFLWISLAKSTVILVKTEETRLALPWPFRKRATVFSEIGVDVPPDLVLSSARAVSEPLRVLFVGRLLGWKGAHLAVRAVAQAVKAGCDVELTVVGDGPYSQALHLLADALAQRVTWVPQMSQSDLFETYRSMDCFLFPSLHDSSGNVVLEAQANGLPVICLDRGGPQYLVCASSALVIDTTGCSESDVVDRLSSALVLLANDEERRSSMSVAAVAHVAESCSWEEIPLKAVALATKAGCRD